MLTLGSHGSCSRISGTLLTLILVTGGSMAAWPINLFLAKASEGFPLERSPYCSDPDCEYCKELEAALQEVRRHNAKLLTTAGSLRNQSFVSG